MDKNEELDELVERYIETLRESYNIRSCENDPDELFFDILEYNIVDVIASVIKNTLYYCYDYGQYSPNDIVKSFLRYVKTKEDLEKIIDKHQNCSIPFVVSESKFLTKEDKIELLKKMLFKNDDYRYEQIETSVRAFKALRWLGWQGE